MADEDLPGNKKDPSKDFGGILPTNRREFIHTAGLVGASAVISVAAGIPIIGSFATPLMSKSQKADFIPVCKESELTVGTPIAKFYKVRIKQNWVQEKIARRKVWLLKKEDGSIKAYNPSCTHLGCSYNWREENEKREGHFHCPCHGAEFNTDGEVIHAPPKRDLDTYEAKFERGMVHIIPTTIESTTKGGEPI